MFQFHNTNNTPVITNKPTTSTLYLNTFTNNIPFNKPTNNIPFNKPANNIPLNNNPWFTQSPFTQNRDIFKINQPNKIAWDSTVIGFNKSNWFSGNNKTEENSTNMTDD